MIETDWGNLRQALNLNIEKFLLLFFGVLIALGAMEGLSAVIGIIDVSVLPESWQIPVSAFFSVLTIKLPFFVALFRNLWGFARNYFKSEYKEVYIFRKFGETFAYYQGFLGTALAISYLLPQPWNQIMIAVMTVLTVMFDFALSEYRKL